MVLFQVLQEGCVGSGPLPIHSATRDLNQAALLLSAVWVRLAFVFLLMFECFSTLGHNQKISYRVLIIW